MPRFRRENAPGYVHHIIARCIGGEFFIRGPLERENYLSRVGHVALMSGWIPLCYGVMSNHIHWGVIAAQSPVAKFTRPLHTGFARWLNGLTGRIGPVFTGRPTVRVRRTEDVGALIAYIHNNPVRADVVRYAGDSTWTSHKAYLGAVEPPPWLSVDFGLQLAGFGNTPEGRNHFDQMVRARASEPRDPTLSVVFEAERRTRIRGLLGSAVEVGSPRDVERAELVSVYAPEGGILRTRWTGELRELIATASEACGVDPNAVTSRDRSRTVAHTRRLIVLAGTEFLGRPLGEVAAAVGISSPAAAHLLRRRPRATATLRGTASDVAARLRMAVRETKKLKS